MVDQFKQPALDTVARALACALPWPGLTGAALTTVRAPWPTILIPAAGTFPVGQRAARSIPERWPAAPLLVSTFVWRFKVIDARVRGSHERAASSCFAPVEDRFGKSLSGNIKRDYKVFGA